MLALFLTVSEYFSMQLGLRVTPGKWSTPQTAGGNSVDKSEHLWSESPDIMSLIFIVYAVEMPSIPTVFWDILLVIYSESYSCVIARTQQGQASSVLLQHPEMCQSSGAAGVPVPHHAGLKHELWNFMLISTFCLFNLLIVMIVCCLCPVMCETLSWQAPHCG